MEFTMENLGEASSILKLVTQETMLELSTRHQPNSAARASVIHLNAPEARALAGVLSAMADVLESRS